MSGCRLQVRSDCRCFAGSRFRWRAVLASGCLAGFAIAAGLRRLGGRAIRGSVRFAPGSVELLLGECRSEPRQLVAEDSAEQVVFGRGIGILLFDRLTFCAAFTIVLRISASASSGFSGLDPTDSSG